MTYDTERASEGFELLFSKLATKDLLELIDDPRLPAEILFKAITERPRYANSLAEAMTKSDLNDEDPLAILALAKVNDPSSLYSRLVNGDVLSRYVRNITHPPFTFNEHRKGSPYKYDGLTKDYVMLLTKAVRALEQREPLPSEALNHAIGTIFNNYNDIMLAIAGVETDFNKHENYNNSPESIQRKQDAQTQMRNIREQADPHSGWPLPKIYATFENFVTTIVQDPYLSKSPDILVSAKQVLETVKTYEGKLGIPANVEKNLLDLLAREDIFDAQRKIDAIMAAITPVLETITPASADLNAADFIERYNNVSEFLSKHKGDIPSSDLSNITKTFATFTNHQVQIFGVNFAKPENNEGLLEFCQAIRSDETLSLKFLQTLTAKTKDMGTITKVAAALTAVPQ